MITLIRSNVDDLGDDYIYGKITLRPTNPNKETVVLFTKEKRMAISKSWPYGNVMDSCVPFGQYQILRSYSKYYENNEIFLYGPQNGVHVYSNDRPSQVERYGCLFTYDDISKIGGGCIQLGLDVVLKNGQTDLTGCAKAYTLFRSWIDNNISETDLLIRATSSAKERIV